MCVSQETLTKTLIHLEPKKGAELIGMHIGSPCISFKFNRKSGFLAILIVVLGINLFAGLGNANPMPLPQLPTPIYINSDGTVEGGAGAIQRSGNLYLFTQDVKETIEIHKNGVIIDGNGYTITKPPQIDTSQYMTPVGWFPSINVSNCLNIIFRNIKFDKCHTALSVQNSTNIIIIQNTMHKGNEGIYLSSCSNCSIIGNEIVDNSAAGMSIMDCDTLNIAYNTLSRNHFHGAWIATNDSNMFRNNITDNAFNHFGNGLYLYGPNNNNRIFENNFINNEVGLFYQGSRGISRNNQVYSNYWNNSQDAIVNVAADSASGINQSPLTNPISTAFDPSLYTAFMRTPTASTNAEPPQVSKQWNYAPILIATFLVLIAVVFLATYKRKLKKLRHKMSSKSYSFISSVDSSASSCCGSAASVFCFSADSNISISFFGSTSALVRQSKYSCPLSSCIR